MIKIHLSFSDSKASGAMGWGERQILPSCSGEHQAGQPFSSEDLLEASE
jgi:hypothetical protein